MFELSSVVSWIRISPKSADVFLTKYHFKAIDHTDMMMTTTMMMVVVVVMVVLKYHLTDRSNIAAIVKPQSFYRKIIDKNHPFQDYLQQLLSNPEHPHYKNLKENTRSYSNRSRRLRSGGAAPVGATPQAEPAHGHLRL